MANTRLLKISNNRIFFTPDTYIDINKINLSKGDIRFRTNEDIYLTVEAKSFNNITKVLVVKIIDYKPKDISCFDEQKISSRIDYLIFEPVEWRYFESLLSVYTRMKLIREKLIIDNKEAIQPSKHSTFSRDRTHFERIEFQPSLKSLDPVIAEISEEFDVYYKDAFFNLGFVSFDYKSKLLGVVVSLKIDNSYILPEFNSIKSFFPKALGGNKKFKVKAKYVLTNKIVTSTQALSEEIDKINEAIIESIKKERILNLTTTPLIAQPNKALFTTDDILDNFETNSINGNAANLNEQDILRTILDFGEVRNSKHLQYLAGSEHSTRQKLRFTLKPIFGFLFFIEGQTKNHYCWELLNSHATYLWSFDRIESEINIQYKRIEETINTIRDLKRERYKAAYRANKIDADLNFSTIEHSKISSALIDGFVVWKHKLKERLT